MRAILTYHSIDPSGSAISTDTATFRRQIEWLAGSDVPVVSVDALLAMEDVEEGVALTFDDAFENFGSVAWPLLRDRGLPATVFVVSDHVGGSNDWGGREEPGIPTLPLLGWDDLGRLAEQGVTVGSHTRTHPRLAGLEPDRLQDEVEGSAAAIERELGKRPNGFAYPYGSVDGASAGTVEGAYAWACTTELAAVEAEDSRHRLPRLDAYYFRDAGRLEAWGSARFRVRLAVRRVLRRARARLVEGAGAV
ncbi:MAG: polysaccharide deacetylase family protein [Gemmatimonadota bacterium]|nr:polysaccharide deacetylase family protein [Gemmatimonadota bacterium]